MPRISTPEADGDAHWRLARRLVEIRDGLLLLAPYRDPALDAELRTASADPAVVEAARVAAALSAHRRGAPPRPDPPEPPAVQAADVASETAWLRRVARAYHRSPVVARYRRAGKESRA
ncbi:DUF6545 domain-containing protein [Saccharopolyspora rosea]|uniref:DUF6545 domain-containing protein n=1 Tax=Saccharopolyspora rosea TaxID=524884 RepID=A0ABW3FQD1_9PSEU